MLAIAAQPTAPAPAPQGPHRVLGTAYVVGDDPHDGFDGGEPADSEGPFTFCLFDGERTDVREQIHLISTPVGPAFAPPSAEQLIGRTEAEVSRRGRRFECRSEARWTEARAAIDAARNVREAQGELLWEIFWPAELIDQ